MHRARVYFTLYMIKYFLNVKVTRSKQENSHLLTQYILNLGTWASKLSFDQNLKISKDDYKVIPNPTMYKRLVRRLMYITLKKLSLSYLI